MFGIYMWLGYTSHRSLLLDSSWERLWSSLPLDALAATAAGASFYLLCRAGMHHGHASNRLKLWLSTLGKSAAIFLLLFVAVELLAWRV